MEWRKGVYLIRLHYNKNVVYSDSQHQEWNDFNHNEGERDTKIAEDPKRRGHRTEHNQDTRNSQRDLRVHLQGGGGTGDLSCSSLSLFPFALWQLY